VSASALKPCPKKKKKNQGDSRSGEVTTVSELLNFVCQRRKNVSLITVLDIAASIRARSFEKEWN